MTSIYYVIELQNVKRMQCDIQVVNEILIALYFRYMKNGAVNIYNSPNVIVKNCTFYNNTSDGSHIKAFQTSSGGLSISYKSKTATSINIIVIGCKFISNIASSVHNLNTRSSVQSFFRNTFDGRGGGLSILANTSSAVNCTIRNSTFSNNIAKYFGGGFYCPIVQAHSDHTYVLENVIFKGNAARYGGAFIYGTVFKRSIEALYTLQVYNCTFMDNTAGIGGALHISIYDGLTNNLMIFKQCNFARNCATEFGGTVDIVSQNFYMDRSQFTPVAFVEW